MAGVLRSLLAPALKKLADKGENIPFDSLENRLKREGVSDSELNKFGDAIQNEADKSETFLLQPDITTTTKKGNPAFTPKGLEKIQELQPTFKTIEETQYDRDQLDFEKLQTSEIGRDLESETILGEINELQRKREELLARTSEAERETLSPDELNEIELEADMLQNEILVLDNRYGQNLLREDSVPEYKFQEFYKNVSPVDVNDDTYGMLVVKDPRDNTTGQSAHLDYLGRENYSYHMRYDTDEEALRVFEMQRDIVKDEFNTFNYYEATQYADVNLSSENLKIIQDQVDKIDGLPTNPDVPEENFSKIKRKELEKLNNLWNELTGAEIIELDYYQNLINRSLVKADNEGLNKVKFLINPDGRTARRVARSEAIQRHYSTVVANQIRKTAKKIGASAIMDKKGYLVVGLPAAGFTLPLYGEENKEASFIATAASKGMDRDKAKEIVNDRVSEFPFPVDKESNRENFNIGGRVLRSLGRTRRAEGGLPPHRGYFKPVKELLIDNKDKEFVKRILNPSLNDNLKRDKSVAKNETHRMAAEVDEKGNWYVFPNVINKGDTLTKPKNPMKVALDNNEYISFGKDKDQALWFAADNYKTQEFRDHYK
jgi:hypothetical protein